MPVNDILLVIVSGLGVIHGLFLAIFLWGYNKGNKVSNQLLSLLLLVLSFRVGKSVFLEFAEQIDVKLIFTGLGTLMAIGPLFFLFVKSCSDQSFQLRRKHGIHFIPTVLGILFGLYLEDVHLETLPLTLFAVLFIGYYAHLMTYLIISKTYISKQKKSGLDQEIGKLLNLLFYALVAIWFVYVLNLIDEIVPYVIGPILYSIIAYVVSFIIFQKGYILKIHQTKYKSTAISDERSEELYEKVKKLIEKDKAYKNPDLTLKSLSETLHVSTQILSMVINQKSNNNFNGFINHYRIEESKRLLHDKDFSHLTVAAIAMEVGFNSISSFNTAFKKQTGTTPVNFRKELIK